jgi:hypothetical protein
MNVSGVRDPAATTAVGRTTELNSPCLASEQIRHTAHPDKKASVYLLSQKEPTPAGLPTIAINLKEAISYSPLESSGRGSGRSRDRSIAPTPPVFGTRFAQHFVQ